MENGAGFSRASRHDDAEQKIVERARGGNRSAMGLLLHRYDPQMRAVAWRMLGDGYMVDDALQDAYLNACRSMRRFRGDSAFGTWLHRIVTNSCVDNLKKVARRKESALPEREMRSAEERYPRIEHQTIENVLRDLPPKQRAVLLLVDFEGYSYQEVADIFETSTGTVGSWLSRARANLRLNGASNV